MAHEFSLSHIDSSADAVEAALRAMLEALVARIHEQNDAHPEAFQTGKFDLRSDIGPLVVECRVVIREPGH